MVKNIGRMCIECGFDEAFVDIDEGAIPPGSNYHEEIRKAVAASDVLLVLIGNDWQSILVEKWHDPNDMVQHEIGLALELNKTIVPILLGGRMPQVDELPEALQTFHFKNGQSFEPDTLDSMLPLLLKKLLGESEETPPPAPLKPPPITPVSDPLADIAARAKQRKQEALARERRLAERKAQWDTQFGQFQQLRESPHLGADDIREALAALCRHYETEYPEDWDGKGDLLPQWQGNQLTLVQRERGFDLGFGVLMPMCLIQPGKVQGENGIITVDHDFWIGKYPVTQGEWTAVMGDNPSHFTESGDRAPVEQVSWEDTQTFFEKVGGRFRLPTEDEWEYACRAGTTGDFNVDGAEVSDLGWYGANCGGKTHPVGQKRPNAWGLHDMHGNVLEWCKDWYNSDKKGRVLRGGSWFDGNECSLRSSFRRRITPAARGLSLGFRCVCVVG